MSTVTAQISVSLDGFAAGPSPTSQQPLGEGGEGLHEWALGTESWRTAHGLEGGDRGVDNDVIAKSQEGVGAHIMGRRMFGGGEGEWDPEWKGWWGEEPPFRTPVFVLTHHVRNPLEMRGGTTFHFITSGIEAALSAAREAAGGRRIAVVGGASAIQQYLAAGHLDELRLHIAPVFLGGGTRLFENVGGARLEPVDVLASPNATHITYRVAR